jgi:predicted membrane protein
MNVISSGIFWGLLLVLIGLSIIIKVIFHIDIPVFRIVIGLLLLYFGFQIIFGSSIRTKKKVVIENKSYREYSTKSHSNEYNIIFSNGTIDLSDWQEKLSGNYIEVNVIFGSGLILIDPKMNLQIEANTVFGEAILPNNKVTFLGSKKEYTGTKDSDLLYLAINTIFGNVTVREKDA